MGSFVVLIIIIFAFSFLRNIFKRKKIIEVPTSKYPNKLTKEEYNEILVKYKESIASDENPKSIEKKANDFEAKFYLRALFDFFDFLQEHTANRYNSIDIKNWWSDKLINLSKIVFGEQHTYSTSIISVKLDKYEIEFSFDRKTHIDEFERTSSPWDTTYYDYDRKITIKDKDNIVYQISGHDWRLDNDPPNIPNSCWTTIFKPSDWVFVIHNFIIDFTEEKQIMEKRIEEAKTNIELKKTKERFSV